MPLDFLSTDAADRRTRRADLAGGGPDTELVAVKDAGDHAEEVWRRGDVHPLTTAAQAGRDIAYTVIDETQGDERRTSLLVFTPENGQTVNTYPLPDATGFPVGIRSGRTAGRWATSDGQVYGFAAAG